MKIEKIKQNAKKVFETIDDIDKVYATEDGQMFTPANKSAAEDYAHRINGTRREKPLKIYTIKRTDVLNEKESEVPEVPKKEKESEVPEVPETKKAENKTKNK